MSRRHAYPCGTLRQRTGAGRCCGSAPQVQAAESGSPQGYTVPDARW